MGDLVSYFAFVDGTIIFTSIVLECLATVMDFLKKYQAHSGLKINIHKSSFISSFVMPVQMVDIITNITGFKQQQLPSKYLGVLMATGKQRSVLFDGIISTV